MVLLLVPVVELSPQTPLRTTLRGSRDTLHSSDVIEVQNLSVLSLDKRTVWGRGPQHRESSLHVTVNRDPVSHRLSVFSVDRVSRDVLIKTNLGGVSRVISVKTPRGREITLLLRRNTYLPIPEEENHVRSPIVDITTVDQHDRPRLWDPPHPFTVTITWPDPFGG